MCLITSVVSSFTVFANPYSEFVNGRYFSDFANAFQKPHVFTLAAFSPPHLSPTLSSLRAKRALNDNRAHRRRAWTWPTDLWEKRRDFGPLLLSFMGGRLRRLMSELISINFSLFPIKPAKQPEQQSISTMSRNEPASPRAASWQNVS